MSKFPHKAFSHKSVSDAIKAVFPSTQSKLVEKSRQKHIFGLGEGSNMSTSGYTSYTLRFVHQ